MVIAHATSANHQKIPIRVRIDALNADRFLAYVFSYRYYLWHSIMSNQMSIIHVSGPSPSFRLPPMKWGGFFAFCVASLWRDKLAIIWG